MSTKPLGTRLLKVTIDGVERSADVASCHIDSAEQESDFLTFADAAAGGARAYTLAFTATQDPGDPESLFNLLWDNAGQEVEVEVAPYGNAAPTAAQPTFTGTVVVTEPDGIMLGGDADPSTTAKFTMELVWPFLAKPLRDDGGVA